MSSTITSPPAPAAGPALIAEAERLVPLLRRQAAAIERERRLTPAVHAALLDAGLYRLTTPLALNGADVSLTETMRILEILAAGDASSAWSVWSALGLPAMAAFLDEGGAREMFGPRGACAVGSVARVGRAETVPGGYRVSGRWPFVSGIHQATHAGGLCAVFDGGLQRAGPDGQPAMIMPVWPAAACTVIEVWDTTGLRGTGSDDIEVRDLFVPERFAVDFARPPRPGLSPLHYLHVDNAANVTVAAIALGVAGAALAAFRDLGLTRREPEGDSRADSPLAVLALGSAEVRVAQARGHLYETVDRMCEEVISTGAYPGEAWLPHTSLASVAAVDAAIEVVGALYRAAGSIAVARSGGFDRPLRDLFTLGAHKMVQHRNLLQYGGVTFARAA